MLSEEEKVLSDGRSVETASFPLLSRLRKLFPKSSSPAHTNTTYTGITPATTFDNQEFHPQARNIPLTEGSQETDQFATLNREGARIFHKVLDLLAKDPSAKPLRDLPDIAAVFIGIKSAAGVDLEIAQKLLDLVKEIDPQYAQQLDILPDSEDSRGINAFLVDKNYITHVINTNPDYFNAVDDYEELKEQYGNSFSMIMRTSLLTNIRTGIILGYPKDDVVTYACNKQKEDVEIYPYINNINSLHTLGLSHSEIEQLTRFERQVHGLNNLQSYFALRKGAAATLNKVSLARIAHGQAPIDKETRTFYLDRMKYEAMGIHWIGVGESKQRDTFIAKIYTFMDESGIYAREQPYFDALGVTA